MKTGPHTSIHTPRKTREGQHREEATEIDCPHHIFQILFDKLPIHWTYTHRMIPGCVSVLALTTVCFPVERQLSPPPVVRSCTAYTGITTAPTQTCMPLYTPHHAQLASTRYVGNQPVAHVGQVRKRAHLSASPCPSKLPSNAI